jgi:tetratricopeptide (TPR) repeat protein
VTPTLTVTVVRRSGALALAEQIDEEEVDAAEAAPSAEGFAAAMIAALRRLKSGARADPEFDAFLRHQTRLIDLQTEHLHEQRELVLSRLRWGRFGDRLKVALQLMTMAVGLAIAAGVGAMAWSAHEDHGVAIEAFSTPPDLAARGLTGQVAASQLLDRLAELQRATATARPASSYANDWGSDIKVEIPETGVSIGELNRWLRQWLGGETRISGEIVRTPAGLAVTARSGDGPASRFEGPETDVDTLIGQTAEAVYRQTQPYRYAVYLASSGRHAEAIAAFARLAKAGPSEDRAWAYAGWASTLFQDKRYREAIPEAEAALALNPRLAPALLVLNGAFANVDRLEDHLVWGRRELALLKSGRAVGEPASQIANFILERQFVDALAIGDYRAAGQLGRGLEPVDVEGQAGSYRPYGSEIEALARDHDVAGSRAFAALHPQDLTPAARYGQAAAVDDWGLVAAFIDGLRREPATVGAPLDLKAPSVAAGAATAYANVGRLADAEASLQAMPADCYDCLRAHGLIAALKGDWPGVDRWYGEAARQGPSLPFAHTDWGRALLRKGDPDGAIARLTEAHRRSPQFADPLELWGEALMRKGDYAGAIGRFAEADREAPRWGRNHLRWGEALMLSGRYREARAQYQAAAGLDLSIPDRAALDLLLARTASGPLRG